MKTTITNKYFISAIMSLVISVIAFAIFAALGFLDHYSIWRKLFFFITYFVIFELFVLLLVLISKMTDREVERLKSIRHEDISIQK